VVDLTHQSVIFIHGITNNNFLVESLNWKVTLPDLLPEKLSLASFNLNTHIDDQSNLLEFINLSRQVLEGLHYFFDKRAVRGIA
jgi:hypothetical protein